VKHVALFGAVGLTPLFLWQIWKSENRIQKFAITSAIFLALGTISLVRTYALTGDPLYPESRARAADFSVVNHPYQSTGERVMRYAGIPWLLHFDGQRAFESTSHNPMGMWLVFFWPGLFALREHRTPALRMAAVFAGLYLLYWVSILVTLRYALLPLALVVACTAPGIYRLPRWAAACATAAALFFSLTVSVLLEVSAPQLTWAAGRLDRTAYLTKALPEYGAVHALHSLTAPSDRVLSLDNCASVYAPRVERFHCLFQRDAGNDPARIAEFFRQGGYRFLILPEDGRRDAVLSRIGPGRERFRDGKFSVYDFVE
jgi:hypothetical protein